MSRKHKKGYELKSITMEEAKALTCGKMIYEFGYLYDQDDNIIGKSIIFMENFYETRQPEEFVKRWSIDMFDDGRLMFHEW